MGVDPQFTYFALLVIQAFHLLHHRFAKRHISYIEGMTALILIYPPTNRLLPPIVVSGTHLIFGLIQIVGSVWIKKLSPK